MKILKINKKLTGQKNIDVGHRIEQIIQMLENANCILGDDVAQRHALSLALIRLDRLVRELEETEYEDIH